MEQTAGGQMLRVSVDESSDEAGKRVFAAAGIVGREHAWQALEAKWVDAHS